jgi:hypothetical protein
MPLFICRGQSFVIWFLWISKKENLGKDTMNTVEIIHEVAHANVGLGRGHMAVKLMDANILERALYESLGSCRTKATKKFFRCLHIGLISNRNALLLDTFSDDLQRQTIRDYEESITRLEDIAREHSVTYERPQNRLPEQLQTKVRR